MKQAASHRLGSQYALEPHSIDLSSTHLLSDIDLGVQADSCFTVNHDGWLSVQVWILPPLPGHVYVIFGICLSASVRQTWTTPW